MDAQTLEPARSRRRRPTGTASSRRSRTSTTTWSTRSRAGCREELTGTLYRNGPARTRSAASRTRISSTATGCCRSSRFDGRRIRYRNRFVRTDALPRRARGRQAGHARLRPAAPRRAARRTPSARPRTSPTRASSTTPGNLLALYEGGRPWQLDPDTLETRRRVRLRRRAEGRLHVLRPSDMGPRAPASSSTSGSSTGRRTKLRTYRVDRAGRLHHLQRSRCRSRRSTTIARSRAVHGVRDRPARRCSVPRFLLGFTSLDKSLRFDSVEGDAGHPRAARRRQAAHRRVRAVLPLPHQQRLRGRRRRGAGPGALPGLRQHPPRLSRRSASPAFDDISTTFWPHARLAGGRGRDRGHLLRTAASSRSTTGG